MIVEYIWLDNQQHLRSKIHKLDDKINTVKDIPEVTFDGSSTKQSSPECSDLILKPCKLYPSPFPSSNYLVLCEVYNINNKPHETNTRAKLLEAYDTTESLDVLVGVEQEYILMMHHSQNVTTDFNCYCSVGYNKIRGRQIAEQHFNYCIKANIKISGMHAEVTPSQWEYQLGPADPLTIADDLWISRYILYRITENHQTIVTFHPKPFPNYNGSGCHINISTKQSRQSWDGVMNLVELLSKHHNYLMKAYGKDNQKRLTGTHETSHYSNCSYGIMNRSVSIRIPYLTYKNKRGYVEDRRPAANIDPYEAFTAILKILTNNQKKKNSFIRSL